MGLEVREGSNKEGAAGATGTRSVALGGSFGAAGFDPDIPLALATGTRRPREVFGLRPLERECEEPFAGVMDGSDVAGGRDPPNAKSKSNLDDGGEAKFAKFDVYWVCWLRGVEDGSWGTLRAKPGVEGAEVCGRWSGREMGRGGDEGGVGIGECGAKANLGMGKSWDVSMRMGVEAGGGRPTTTTKEEPPIPLGTDPLVDSSE